MIGDLTSGYMVSPANADTRARLQIAAAKRGVPVDGVAMSRDKMWRSNTAGQRDSTIWWNLLYQLQVWLGTWQRPAERALGAINIAVQVCNPLAATLGYT
jgi:hypothetical protein